MDRYASLVVTLCLLLLAAVSSAQTVYTVQNGNWADTATWSDGEANRLPTASDLTYIAPSHTVSAATAGVAEYLIVGIHWAPGLGQLNVADGANLSFDGGPGFTALSVGHYGTDGTVTMTGGILNANGWAKIGDNDPNGVGAIGQLNISGGNFAVTEIMTVGYSGAKGTVTQTGGSVSTALLHMGNYNTDTANSNYSISGNSNLTIGGGHIGFYNNAEFRVIGSEPSIHVTTGNLLINNWSSWQAGTSHGTLAFEIDPLAGIAPIIVDTGYVTIAHGTAFEFSGGLPGQSYVLVEVMNPANKIWTYPTTYTINDTLKYSLSVSPDELQLIVTVAPCEDSALEYDLNGDCIINYLDFALLAEDWMLQGTLQ